MSEELLDPPEKLKSSILIRLDEHTRDRLDKAVARMPDPHGMQAAISRAALKLYLTLSEQDFEAAEMQIKRIVQNPSVELKLTHTGVSPNA